jgi:hypothetical protein
MKIEQIKALASREPFRQFAIVLASGHEIIVGQASELLFPPQRPELIMIFSENATWQFEAQAVTALQE